MALSRTYDTTHRRAIPDYLKEDLYPTIHANADRIDTVISPLAEHLKTQAPGKYDRFVLLDSQDWMKPEQITEQWAEIARVGSPGTRIIFRTGGMFSPVEKALPPDLRQRFVYEEQLSKELFEQDRSGIYGGFHIYSKPE
jgi:S-adenosylmethionine-diacylglycerol 3-amino-3-carboxypropyl transferase